MGRSHDDHHGDPHGHAHAGHERTVNDGRAMDGHPRHLQHLGRDTDGARPAEPGYPEHPELGMARAAVRDSAEAAAGAHAEHGAHDEHAGHGVAMFRDKFWLSLLLTLPTLVWGHMLQRALGYTAPPVPGARWIPAVFGTAVFVYGGWPFLHGARRELRDRLPGMMTLIALAISVAFAFSAAVTLGFPGMLLWEELATLVTIMLLGHWLEMRSIAQARGALGELAKLLPRAATRIVGGGDRSEEVPVSALRNGDVVLVRPGQSVPADGLVRAGTGAVPCPGRTRVNQGSRPTASARIRPRSGPSGCCSVHRRRRANGNESGHSRHIRNCSPVRRTPSNQMPCRRLSPTMVSGPRPRPQGDGRP